MKITVLQASLLCMVILAGLALFGMRAYRAGKGSGYMETAEAGAAMAVVSAIAVIMLVIKTAAGIM